MPKILPVTPVELTGTRANTGGKHPSRSQIANGTLQRYPHLVRVLQERKSVLRPPPGSNRPTKPIIFTSVPVTPEVMRELGQVNGHQANIEAGLQLSYGVAKNKIVVALNHCGLEKGLRAISRGGKIRQ